MVKNMKIVGIGGFVAKERSVCAVDKKGTVVAVYFKDAKSKKEAEAMADKMYAAWQQRPGKYIESKYWF